MLSELPELHEPPELTVIIISYNTRALTLAALHSLYAINTTARFRTVVFDNSSADGSPEAIATAFPQVDLHRSPENLGFARANNLVAAEAKTDWLLLLNPDTEVHAGAIDAILALGKAKPEAGIYGGRTVFPDGRLNIASCWNRITIWSTFCAATGLTAAFPKFRPFNPEAICGWNRDSLRHVDIVVGCFLLIRRSLWAELGGFDLRYFMYGEDADLCLRAIRKGYRPMITPTAEIMHIVGAASKSRKGKQFLLAKGRVTLIRDHWPSWQVPLGVALMWLWAALRYGAAKALRRCRGSRGEDRFALWAEIWQNRANWLQGY